MNAENDLKSQNMEHPSGAGRKSKANKLSVLNRSGLKRRLSGRRVFMRLSVLFSFAGSFRQQLVEKTVRLFVVR